MFSEWTCLDDAPSKPRVGTPYPRVTAQLVGDHLRVIHFVSLSIFNTFLSFDIVRGAKRLFGVDKG